MGFFDSIPQQVRVHPDMDTGHALEILNALLGRFQVGSVVGEAVYDAIAAIEHDIEQSMRQSALSDSFPGMADAVATLNELGVRK